MSSTTLPESMNPSLMAYNFSDVSPSTFSIMSLNVNMYQDGQADQAGLPTILDTFKPDILCLQEHVSKIILLHLPLLSSIKHLGNVISDICLRI